VSLAFVFPGQGSQKVGMGAALLAERPELLDRYFTLADEISGLPVRRCCLEGPIEELTRTDIAQPALFAVGAALADAAAAVGLSPAFVAGHSLGEYTAAVAAGALSPEDGMRVVCERGRLMAGIQNERPGAMAAIIGLELAPLAQLCAEVSANSGLVSVANLNSPTQIVVSGEKAGVAKLVELAPDAGAKKAVPLQVGAAFHSQLMVPVQERLRDTIAGVPFSDAHTPLVAVCSGEALTDAGEIREALLAQIVSPVRWVDVVQTLAGAGVDSFLELGPGRVLIGLIRAIVTGVEMTAADSIEKLSEFAGTHA
jgi:[acyl-carrier-protein] S-malonyltransferase